MHLFSYYFTSKHLADAAPPMKPLVYEPERGLQAALGAFLQDKVFIDEDDGMVRLVFIDATKRYDLCVIISVLSLLVGRGVHKSSILFGSR